MKAQTFTINSIADMTRLQVVLMTGWKPAIDGGKPLVVKVTDKTEEYTAAQRRLYFMWCTQFGKKFGDHQDAIHHDIKKRFLINIYYRDDPEFAAMCDAVHALKESEPQHWHTIREHVIKETSITKASKVQMSEFMDEFYRFAQKHGCHLTTPDDLKFATEMAA